MSYVFVPSKVNIAGVVSVNKPLVVVGRHGFQHDQMDGHVVPQVMISDIYSFFFTCCESAFVKISQGDAALVFKHL